jgi:hypothetical protein
MSTESKVSGIAPDSTPALSDEELRERNSALRYATASVALEGMGPTAESNRYAALYAEGRITFDQMLNLEGADPLAEDEKVVATEPTTGAEPQPQAIPSSATALTVQERMLETARRLGNDPNYRDKLKHLLF